MKPRRFKWLKRSFLAFVVLLAIVAIVMTWTWYSTRSAGEKRLALVIQELDSREPGWREFIETRNQTLAPADKNSALKAAPWFNSISPEIEPWTYQYEQATSDVQSSYLDPLEWIDELKKNLAPHRKQIEFLKTFTHIEPNSGFPIDFDGNDPISIKLPGREDLKKATKLLMYESRLQVLENHPDEAIRCCRAIAGLSRAMGDEPLLISQYYRLSQNEFAIKALEKTLGCGEPKQGLAELQNELASLTESNYLLVALKGERQAMDVLYQSLDEGRYDSDMIIIGKSNQNNIKNLYGLVWKNYRRYMPGLRAEQLELFNRMIAAAISPSPERTNQVDKIDIELREMTGYRYRLTRFLFPSCQKINGIEIRTKTRLYCAICAIACERFRLKNQRWPKDLNEIPKEILPTVPHDCYFDEPLKLHRTETGLVITNSSVGDFNDVQDGEIKGKFTGIRLYDPQFRRQTEKTLAPPKLDEKSDRN